jgi:ERF superfamily.
MTDIQVQQTMDLAVSNGGAVSAHEENALPVDPFLSIIERALFSPEADISKLERIIALRDQGIEKQAKSIFIENFAAMQAEIPPILKKGKGHNNAKYIRFEDMNAEIKLVLPKYGFSLSFETEQSDKNVTVKAILEHVAGHRKEASLILPLDTTGNKNAVQAIGSTISYGKRYTAGSLLNIAADGEDDDAQIISQKQSVEFITEEQVADLQSIIEETKSDLQGFLAWCKIKSLADMPAAHFRNAMSVLEKKRRQ